MPLRAFHPTLRSWFGETLGEPTRPQEEGWPAIRAGRHCLIAAPTGTGKTLAAFFTALDDLVRQGPDLPDATQVVYVSPLKALGNDVEKNLRVPLEGIRERDFAVPAIRVAVRSGDTPPAERQKMLRRPPHVLVTTPESLAILLTSEGGRGILGDARTVIVDEIHAMVGDKRGAHLALSLERFEHLVLARGRPAPQRIGLSATQKPVADVARFLVGQDRDCTIVDGGHLRDLDLAVEVPGSPLEAVCSHETWGEIYERVAALIREHRTTLVFVNTRKLAERLSVRLAERFADDPEGAVCCHHGSLSKERRLEAEGRLKDGRLRALVATASLELGIDIGDVDLVVQIGTVRTIATFLQRVGRAGHGVDRVSKGRLFPLTIGELDEAAAIMRAVRRGELDRTPQPVAPLDILAQHAVAACVAHPWDEGELYDRLRRARPYRDLAREEFERVLALHSGERRSLLHRDAISGTVRATRRARLVAITCGGAIPDRADFAVREEPSGAAVGTLDEDFALESQAGDIVQLGTHSWRIQGIDGRNGVVHVADAHGAPPTIPFWFGEAPSRSRELCREVGTVRDEATSAAWLRAECGLGHDAADQLWTYLDAVRTALGTVPTDRRVVVERFFDETGGMQMVVHAPLGGRTMRAWALALRKKFCRGFGFELESAATEDAFILSLAPTNSFDLPDVFTYLSAKSARATLTQAVITGGQFEVRWRWNVCRALLVERFGGGKRVPPHLVRLRADDALAGAFPQVQACPENLGPGGIQIPEGHPIVDATLHDCLHELMDIDGLEELLAGIADGTIDTVAIDTAEPSPLARGVLAAQPYAFLDDVELQERRVRAVEAGPIRDPVPADAELDPAAVAEVRDQSWPRPDGPEEVHEILQWIGFVTDAEAARWRGWLEALAAAGRAARDGDRWLAIEVAELPRDETELWRGRMEALGPVVATEDATRAALLALEQEGLVLRARCDGEQVWCHRRLLARIRRLAADRRRRPFAPVAAADFLRFLARHQHVAADHRLEGPRGLATILDQLAGCEVPVAAWNEHVLPARVRDHAREWLDRCTADGGFAWGRLWNPPRGEAGGGRACGAGPVRSTPIGLVPRADLTVWRGLLPPGDDADLSGAGRAVLELLRERGALFLPDLAAAAGQFAEHVEMALAECIQRGLVTCDSFAALRWLLLPSRRRGRTRPPGGRWSVWREPGEPRPFPARHDARTREELALFVARRLLARTGVVFRRTFERERIAIPWREVLRALRALELRGEALGGRFVAGFTGEQYALPRAAEQLRALGRGDADAPPVTVAAADPLNFTGILTPGERIRAGGTGVVRV